MHQIKREIKRRNEKEHLVGLKISDFLEREMKSGPGKIIRVNMTTVFLGIKTKKKKKVSDIFA